MPKDFEIEDSNAMKVLRGTGEADTNTHESSIGGKKVGWLEDFWYRHKWHAGLIAAAVITATVIIVQLILHTAPDVYIMYTGPQAIVGNQYEKLEDAIISAMDDVNGDGKKAISFSDNTYLSSEQVEQRKALSSSFKFDASMNAAAFQRYQMEITAATHMLCMLDPSLFDEMAAAGAFTPLDEIFDTVPKGAYGEYGIRLGDTEFYKSNPDIHFLPADTVLGLRIPGALDLKGSEKKEEYFKRHESVFKSIVEYTEKD